MNKPKYEARGKKQNRGQGSTPDQELRDVLSESAPPIAEGLGISPEALNTEGFSTAEVAERHYGLGVAPIVEVTETEIATGLAESTGVAFTAQAPFPGSEREWTAEEKEGINGALRQYGWKDVAEQEPPANGVGQELGEPIPNTEGSVADALELTEEAGQELRDQYAEVNGTARLKSPDGLMLESGTEVLRILEAGHEAIARGWVKDMKSFMRELLFKLDGVPVTGKPGEFDESWAANQAYHPKNLILFVTRTPRVPIPEVPGDMLTRVLELHTRHITGLRRSSTARERDLQRTGVLFEDAKSAVQMNFGEKYGRTIGKMFEAMMRRVCQVAANDNTTVDFMLIEPDPTHTCVIDAWKCTGMWPSEIENVDAVRNLAKRRDPASVTVHWRGEVARGHAIDAEAQELLSAFIVKTNNPYAPQ